LTSALPRFIRLEKLAPWLVGGGVLAVALWAAQPYAVGVFHDDGVYVTLAKSLATGEGLRYLNLPGAPLATHYPPVYPMLLAVLWKLSPTFPENIWLFQLANAFALALTALGVAAFARTTLGWAAAAAIPAGIVGTLSYPLIGLAGHVLSETLFAAALFPTLMIGERLARADARPRDAWVVGAAAGGVALIRMHGIALVAALVVVLLARRQRRLALSTAAAALVVLAPWQLWVATHDGEIADVLRGKYGSYAPWLVEGLRTGAGFIVATLAANVREIGALMADRFSLSDHALPRLVTGLVASAFLVAGALRLVRRAPVTVAFAAFYMAILLLWPWTPWRFFYAIWPIIIVFLGESVRWMNESRTRAVAMANAGLIVAAALALGTIRAESRAYREKSWYHGAERAAGNVTPLLRWVSSNTAPGDLVAADAEQIVYLFTGRRALPPDAFTAAQYVTPLPMEATTSALQSVLSQFPVNFVATFSPQVMRSARLLSDSAHVASSGTRLVPLPGFRGGGAFRVERRHPSNSQP
jgi:hypothetical protein